MNTIQLTDEQCREGGAVMVTVKVDELEGEALEWAYGKAAPFGAPHGRRHTDSQKRRVIKMNGRSPTVQIPAELVEGKEVMGITVAKLEADND